MSVEFVTDSYVYIVKSIMTIYEISGDDIPELDMPNGYATVKIQYVVLVVQSWVRHYNPGLMFNHFFCLCVSICLIILEKPK